MRIRNLVEKWNLSALMLFVCIKILLFFYKISPARRRDGWRRTTEVYHRTEQAKFIGSLLNLAIDCDRLSKVRGWIIERLYSVFKDTPETRYALRWARSAVVRIPHRYTDFVEARFGPSGELTRMIFHPDRDHPVAAHFDQATILKLQSAYNRTLHLPDKQRPRALLKQLTKNNKKDECLERMLKATWISFSREAASLEDRLAPHYFTRQKHPGFGAINIHCRYSPSEKWADLWLQVSHVAMDGGPAGKLQNRIRKEFGTHDPDFDFHKARANSPESILYKIPEKDVYYGSQSVEFDGILSARKTLLAKYGADLEGNISPVSLLIWGLAQHPQFKEEKFNAPVNIAASGSMEPTVGFVLIKPGAFMNNGSGGDALLAYLREFNRQVRQIRDRRGAQYLFLQSTTMATPWMNGLVLKLFPSGLRAFAGSTCVTVLRGVEYPIPPLSDNIESMIGVSLPMGNGHSQGCVGTAAFTDTNRQMLAAVRDVAENFHRYL
jgi:hypothetical protein